MCAPTKKKSRSKQRVKKIGLIILASLALSAPCYAGGWYYVWPPSVNGIPNDSAPLSEWTQNGAFDTAAACEDHASEIYYRIEKQQGVNAAVTLVASSAKCIASDDPRL